MGLHGRCSPHQPFCLPCFVDTVGIISTAPALQTTPSSAVSVRSGFSTSKRVLLCHCADTCCTDDTCIFIKGMTISSTKLLAAMGSLSISGQDSAIASGWLGHHARLQKEPRLHLTRNLPPLAVGQRPPACRPNTTSTMAISICKTRPAASRSTGLGLCSRTAMVRLSLRRPTSSTGNVGRQTSIFLRRAGLA